MAIQCAECGRQYDATLFEFGRTVGCECGAKVCIEDGHTLRLGGLPRREGAAESGPEGAGDAIKAATWDYLTARHIAEDYDEYFRYNELFAYDVAVLDRWFARPGRLLDLGCGTGRHLAHFALRGFEVTGVDLSEHMLGVASRKLAAAGCTARLVRGDITRLDELGLGTFDYAICMFSTLGMVHGAANRQRFLEAVRSHLAPGGAFAFHVHNRWHALWDADGRRYLWSALRRRLRGEPEAFEKNMDGYRGIRGLTLYVYSAGEARRVAERAGFRVEEIVYLNETRSGRLAGLARGLRSNGFILLCRPSEPEGGWRPGGDGDGLR